MLSARIITGLAFGTALTLSLLFLPARGAAAVLGVLWLVGAWEWAGLAGWTSLPRLAFAAAFAGLMWGVSVWMLGPEIVTGMLVVALLWWLAAFAAVLSYPRDIPRPLVPAAGLLALLPAWAALIHLLTASARGAALVLTVLLIVWAADIGAYGFGRWLGRVKLAPRVSPGKTWEGVTGGVVLAAATAWGAALALSLPTGVMVALGIATALVSVVGDLTVSMFKRNFGVKDTGRLLPGHGGVMDRIDSLTAALPTFTLGLRLAGLA